MLVNFQLVAAVTTYLVVLVQFQQSTAGQTCTNVTVSGWNDDLYRLSATATVYGSSIYIHDTVRFDFKWMTTWIFWHVALKSYIPNSTFYWLMRGFHRTFAMGEACWQGRLLLRTPGAVPFGTCICSTCWGMSFSRTCRYFSGLCCSNIPRYCLDFSYYCFSLVNSPRLMFRRSKQSHSFSLIAALRKSV